MKGGLEAAIARAQGLSARLVPGSTLSALAECTSLAQLAHELEAWLPGKPEEDVNPALIEAWSRSAAGALMETLARWLKLRRHAAEILFAEEEQRALRRIVRGIVNGQPAEWRLRDLLPVPQLPVRALQVLARQNTLKAVAVALTAWRSPYTNVIATLALQASVDPFAIDQSLFQVYLEQARQLVRRAGREFRQHVSNVIDTDNLLAALVIAQQPQDLDADNAFEPGGQNLVAAVFRAAARSKGVDAALSRLRDGTTGWLAAALRANVWSAPEVALLRAWIEHYQRLARVQPLGLWQPALFLLRLRAQVNDVRRLAWGIALQAPPALIREQLVSA